MPCSLSVQATGTKPADELRAPTWRAHKKMKSVQAAGSESVAKLRARGRRSPQQERPQEDEEDAWMWGQGSLLLTRRSLPPVP
mmetsp:Transcript_19490/g.47786  ORF Transcript_19490/g.47786 Transcript_19490/m.47786 type:complete len:83 (-) Transcript_19490:678-926(-)